ncbi:hypothetical protein GDO81_027392 [Engystomops pustulosus]|uniref:Poly [ADP-ribose] polymerase n=1 Tax=Engystomops pustulosus TaxID=76066 RepID=A0AAV6ZF77_ENGPU|nr:hypothetical protein GDO81_027392 [Engystomops pustulosus]
MLTLLVQNLCDRDVDKDFHVEMIPEHRSAVVTFTGAIDIQSFIQSFSNSLRVTQLQLWAKPLEETMNLRVENLPHNTSEQHLTCYFESPRHGGGRVHETVMLPEEGAALLKFCEQKTVNEILKKQHVFNKTAIRVYPFYPSLNIHLYGTGEPDIKVPAPKEFNISPYILEYILKDEDIKLNIESKMEEKHCKINWPSPKCENPIIKMEISQTISTRTMAKVARTWTDTISTEFSLIISRYKVIDCKMNPFAWEDIKAQTSTDAYHGVLVSPNTDGDKVFLAGAIKDVNKIEQNFRKMVEEVTQKAERESQVTTMKVPMSAALYHILCNSGLKKQSLAEVPELKMEYDTSTHNVTLTGLQNEALLAKCEILNVQQKLKSKFVQSSPHVLQFLMSSDNDEVSCLLLVRHNINALIEVEENAIKLTGYTKKDLVDAEEQIRKEVISKQIPVDDKNILRGPEWKSLQSHLLESLNSETSTVIIEEAENHVVVTGLAANVSLSYQQLSDFIKNNSEIEVTVPFRSRVMLLFIEEKRQQIWQNIKTKVRVVVGHNSVSLFAPRIHAEDAAAQLHNLLSSLYFDSLRINKPGAKKFCREQEKIHSCTAKTEFNCALVLESSEESKPLDKAKYEVMLKSGVTIAVYQDDLCRHNVDVIVNAANEDLKHNGGLAAALLKASGNKLQDDCDRIVMKEGKLSAGDSVITDAGNLPCKQVIHTVGPRWDSQLHVRCERLLWKAVTTSLELAADHGHSSIAIPAVSSGIFGFPVKECIKNIVDAIEDYVEVQGSSTSLQRIHLVDMNIQTVNIFSELLRTRFGGSQSRKGSNPHPVRQRPQTHSRSARSERLPGTEEVWTQEGLIIRLVQKKMEDATTDVIVNSVSSDLDLSKGKVSAAISTRAGPGLQQEVDDYSMAQASAGMIINTDGHNLSCKKVLHAVTPNWDHGQGASEKILGKIIRNCLTWTNQQSMKSLSIPALGTGNLNYPKALVAAVTLDAISQFSSKNKPSNLQVVEIVLHPNDKDTIQAFSSELVNYTGSSRRQSNTPGSVFCGTVKNLTLGVHEMRIGSATFQIKTGDITKEAADVIVNSSNNNFTLHSGVSKAILEASGVSVQTAVRTLGTRAQPHKGYIITNAGNLPACSWILHVVGPSQPGDIKKIVLDCLQESEKLQAACVAFPAVGTGAGQLAAAVVADTILEGVMDFISSGLVRSIQTVKVVIFQQHMLNDFYMAMKKKEGTQLPGPKSFLNKLTALLPSVPTFLRPKAQKVAVQKLTAFQLLDNIDPVIFSLCSDDVEKVQRTKQWLQQQIEAEQMECPLTDEGISELEESEYEKILDLQRRFQVSVVYKPPDPCIRIFGLTRDVFRVQGEIQKIINCVKDRKSRERAAELTGNLVEWRYRRGPNISLFSEMVNLELEEARNANKTSITVQNQNLKMTVDLTNMTATDTHGNQLEIERALKHGDSMKLPEHWQPMNNLLVMEVDVPAASPEYTQVQQMFAQTCSSRILKIQRVQNKDLWLNYQIKLQSVNTKNGTTNSEKQLFHGTDVKSIQHINHNGFNRSYAGRHAAMYGNGTYFAVNADYSARGYCPPDANRHKHLYLARVITGVFCIGRAGMVAPPAKNTLNSTDLYDSVTDNTASPSMFIIFNDIQAYPEYHITFY